MDDGLAVLRWTDQLRLPEGSPLAPHVSTPMFQGVSIGDRNAPVTLLIVDHAPFFDLPYYTDFYRRALPVVEKRYLASGIARIVAMNSHAGGSYGIALWCADDQDAGWQFNKSAFSEFASQFYLLADIRSNDELRLFKAIAQHADIDVAGFLSCLNARSSLLPLQSVEGHIRMTSMSNRLLSHPAEIARLSISVGKTHARHFAGPTLFPCCASADATLEWIDAQVSRALEAIEW